MILRNVPRSPWRALRALFLCLVVLTGAVACAGTSAPERPATSASARASGGDSDAPQARPSGGTSPPAWAKGMATVRADALPPQAREVLALIDKGGPYAHRQDGTVFGNFERALPKRERGYYHEFTVRTPGSRDRGARRIVTGRGGEFYYTDDHYQSFKAVLR
ncbi:ribonuclease domain-containing protein [Streptomyces sp. NPDC048606]|uniref:ribonuclease domain-containing protein n=1 Tax=Streptomyces sp. NPDC048606 TaxID=3154726 RepID=UPI003433BDCF